MATSSDIVCDSWILVDDQNYLVLTYMRKPNFKMVTDLQLERYISKMIQYILVIVHISVL